MDEEGRRAMAMEAVRQGAGWKSAATAFDVPTLAPSTEAVSPIRASRFSGDRHNGFLFQMPEAVKDVLGGMSVEEATRTHAVSMAELRRRARRAELEAAVGLVSDDVTPRSAKTERSARKAKSTYAGSVRDLDYVFSTRFVFRVPHEEGRGPGGEQKAED